MKQDLIHSTITEITDLLKASNQMDYIGEAISQLEHALQAAHFAAESKLDKACILAALLHDIGHLIKVDQHPSMGDYGVANHENRGAEYLRKKGFSEKVAKLVSGHVNAKRFLVTTSQPYYQKTFSSQQKNIILPGREDEQA